MRGMARRRGVFMVASIPSRPWPIATAETPRQLRRSSLLQDVVVGHRNPAEHGSDNSEKTLVGAAKVNVVERGATSAVLGCGAVDRTVVMSGEFRNRPRSEHVCRDCR